MKSGLSSCLYFLFFAIFLSSGVTKCSLTESASIFYSESIQDYKIILNTLDPDAVAYATYKPTLEETGFDNLKLTTNQKGMYEDHIISYGAGYLEGYLTRHRILNHFKNLSEKTWGKDQKMPQYIRDYFIQHKQYIFSQYTLNPNDNYWRMAYSIYMQYEGMVDSYNDSVELYKIDFAEFHTITSMGDLFDIVFYKTKVDFNKMDPSEIISLFQKSSHCSALIKYSKAENDLFFGHNSWFYYSAMNRVLKEYHFTFKNPLQKSKSLLFTSYPGAISSIDDFYVTDKDLIVMETTNLFFNSKLYNQFLSPNSLLNWQRSMMSNWCSEDGKGWTDFFVKENSGTYNNQYMILDLKKVDFKSQGLAPDTLWIVEQVPGYTESSDVTGILDKNGYWASYNSPFFPQIRAYSNYDTIIKKDKKLINILDYNMCSRAQIFKRDQGGINSITSFKKMMRYNDYKNDIFSEGNPIHTIAARGDLDESPTAMCMGAYDAKVGSINNVLNKNKKTISIIGSPTNDQQPVFRWSDSKICSDDPKYGLQQEYSFNWFDYSMDIKDNY